MTAPVTILDACDDPNLFARWFRDRDTWAAWRAFLAALFGLPMDDAMQETYCGCTGRSEVPEAPFTEAWLIIGRRGGKSFVMALVAVFLACFKDYREHLAPGERATVLVIATDRRQARVIVRYVRALLTEVPMLARMVERETTESFDLSNRVSIEVATASYRTVRGYTLCAALCDELAFWPTDDAALPDYAVLDALRPAMATIPGAVLLCASSPYARRGALWDAFRRFHGHDGEVLCWKAPTRTMNPTVAQRVIDEAIERDPSWAAAEYLAEFRTDVESYIAREAVEAVVAPGVYERPPLLGVRYYAFVDPSGGSADSMTLGIAHREGAVAILDALREVRPPFSPESVVEDFAEILKLYRVTSISGDRYAGEWVREPFRKRGIGYEPAAQPKSDMYRDLLPKLNSGEVDLLDNSRLVNQLISLERRTSRGGRDSIDHPPGSHDDLCNAAAGALLAVNTVHRTMSRGRELKGFY